MLLWQADNIFYQNIYVNTVNTIHKISDGKENLNYKKIDKVTCSILSENIKKRCIYGGRNMNNSTGSNRMEVPEAKAAMDRFKTEVASELGVPLKEGYNGDLTSAQAGSIGGEMVKKMIRAQEEQMMGKQSQ